MSIKDAESSDDVRTYLLHEHVCYNGLRGHKEYPTFLIKLFSLLNSDGFGQEVMNGDRELQ
jgi:hypothetical protein